MDRLSISLIGISSTAIAVLAGCATPLSPTPPAGLAASVTAPAARTGEHWRYVAHDGYTHLPKGDVELVVTGAESGAIAVTRTESGRTYEERYTPAGGWLARQLTNLQPLRFEPALSALPFPLQAGKTWREVVMATDPATGRQYRVRVDGRVQGWEKVRVPAGEFDALRIERYIYAGNAGSFRTEERIHEVDWYAPRAGKVVRHAASSEYTDLSKSCRSGLCTLIRNDYTVYELADTRTGKPDGT